MTTHEKQLPVGFPPVGLVRLRQIIGDPENGIPAVIPVSPAAWYKGVARGYYPPPIKLTPATSAWRVSDILQIVENGRWEPVSESVAATAEAEG